METEWKKLIFPCFVVVFLQKQETDLYKSFDSFLNPMMIVL